MAHCGCTGAGHYAERVKKKISGVHQAKTKHFVLSLSFTIYLKKKVQSEGNIF